MKGYLRSWLPFCLVIMFCFLFYSCGSTSFFSNNPQPSESSENHKIEELETNLADLQQDQSDLEVRLKQKQDLIQSLKTKITTLETKVAALERAKKTVNPTRYKTPELLYKKARNLLLEDDLVNAASLFNAFIKKYPENSLADNAVYWLAECHYSLGEYKKAISIFKKIELTYPKSEKVPDAILKIGYSYLSLDDTNRAHHHLKKVLTRYPFSQAAEKAQEKLGDFK